MKRKPIDLPREDLMQLAADTLKRSPAGSKVFFKYTCEHCGRRCMLAEPNALYQSGICDACGKETKITKGGFSLHMNLGG